MAKGIIQLPTQLAGTPGITPNFRYMVSADNLSTVSAAGYLNAANLQGIPLSGGDIIQMMYNWNTATNTGTFETFSVSISSTGVITLVPAAGSGSVVLPTTANHIATYTNTSGQLSEDPVIAISAGSIQAGVSGTAGTLISVPSAASKGQLQVAATANTGNTITLITNAAMGQASNIIIPDPGTTNADFVLAPSALVNGNLVKASGTAGLVVDAGIAATNVMLLSASNVMTGTGSITAVKANGTEAANAVTASGMAGVITTSSLNTAGGASYAITWTNTFITSTSVVLLTLSGGTNTTENITFKVAPGTGTATLTIYNNTAATALNGTILISYLVM